MSINRKIRLASWLPPNRFKGAHELIKKKQRFVVLALRRSGHHGVINWICRQHHHRIVFHNLCRIGYKQGNEIQVYGNGNTQVRHIHNFENFDFDKIIQLRLTMPSAGIILVVREARNWIASCLKRRDTARYEYEKDVFINLPERVALWKQHAGIALLAPAWITVVLFDKWFSDAEYRRSICNNLEIPFTDTGLNEVGHFGNGSSFDGRKFDGRAQKMDVLNRWKEFEGDPLMERMMTDDLMELNRKLFPDAV